MLHISPRTVKSRLFHITAGICKSRNTAVVSAVVFCSRVRCDSLKIPFVEDLWDQLDCWAPATFQPHRVGER